MQSYRELRVWQTAMELVVAVYRLSDRFPNNEQFGLTSQLRRVAVSIPSNIAEGFGRDYLKEYLHFLKIAFGSLMELETQIEIAKRLEYIKQPDFESISSTCTILSKQLINQQKALKKSGESSPPK